jgi:hypothetical protein
VSLPRFLAPLTLASLAGCATAHRVSVTPIDTPFPVSASPSWVDARGEVVSTEASVELSTFAHALEVEAPAFQTTSTKLDLAPRLAGEVAEAHGEAVTELAIAAFPYRTEAYTNASGWAQLGLGGLLLVGMAASFGSLATADGPRKVFAGAGLLLMLAGTTACGAAVAMPEPVRWRFLVSGRVVRRRTEADGEPLPEGPVRPRAPGRRAPVRP